MAELGSGSRSGSGAGAGTASGRPRRKGPAAPSGTNRPSNGQFGELREDEPFVETPLVDEDAAPATPARQKSKSGRPAMVGPQPPGDGSEEQAEAREIALRQLTVRARSRVELERALSRKQVAPADAAQVLDRLSEVGLVDDTDFAAQWVASGVRRGRGRRALGAELATKGVSREVIAETLADLDEDHDQQVALAFAERKARQLRNLPEPVRQRRLTGALARRGFSSSVISEVVRTVLADLEAPDSDLAD